MTSINYTLNIKAKRKIYGIIGALITLIVPFFLMLFNHDDHLKTDQSYCPFKMLTGFPCIGCGITKSMVYCYEGNLYKSMNFHVLGPFVLLFCFFVTGVLVAELITKKEYFNGVLFNKKVAYSLAVFLIIYHFFRIVYFVKNNDIDSILNQSIWR